MLTRRGVGLVVVTVVLFATGRVFAVLELFVAGTAFAALLLCALAYTGLSRLRISVDRELHPPRVHAGTPSRVDLRVQNHGRRFTPVLGLRDGVSGTRGAHLVVASMRAGEVARAAYRLPTERRGILRIGPLVVNLGDPFGPTEMSMQASGISELTVYPHVDDIVPIPQTTGNDPMAGAEHPNALGRTGEDFYALRRYVVGDDLRRVHWPSTARHDELMVRQDELPWQGRATVLVDVRAATTTAESLERVISAAASIVRASAARQDLVRLLTTDGSDSGFAAGHAHVEAIMEHLASVEASHDASFRRIIERTARSSTGGALVVVVAGMPAAETDQLLRLRNRFGSVTIVRFADDRMRATPTVGSPRTRETVVAVADDESFPAVWNRMFRTRAVPTRSLARTAAGASAAVGSAADRMDEVDRWSARTRAGS